MNTSVPIAPLTTDTYKDGRTECRACKKVNRAKAAARKRLAA